MLFLCDHCDVDVCLSLTTQSHILTILTYLTIFFMLVFEFEFDQFVVVVVVV